MIFFYVVGLYSVQCSLCIMAWMYNLVPSSPSVTRQQLLHHSTGAMEHAYINATSLQNTHALCLNDGIFKSYYHYRTITHTWTLIKAMPETNLVKTYTRITPVIFLTLSSFYGPFCIQLWSTANFLNKHNHIVLKVLFIYLTRADPGNSSSSASEMIMSLWHWLRFCCMCGLSANIAWTKAHLKDNLGKQ